MQPPSLTHYHVLKRYHWVVEQEVEGVESHLCVCVCLQAPEAPSTPTQESFPKSIKDVYQLSNYTRKRNKEKKQLRSESADAEYVVLLLLLPWLLLLSRWLL